MLSRICPSTLNRQLVFALVFLAGLVALDRSIGLVLRSAYERISTGDAGGQINAAVQHKDADVLVFGSSLARYHVDTRVVSKSLDRQCFNAGCDGQDIYYARMLQSLLFSRGCESKHIVYVLDWSDLYRDDLARAKMFAIFFDEDPIVRDMLVNSGPFERLKLQSHAYRFNSVAVSIFRHLIAPKGEGIDGYVPVDAEYFSSAKQTLEMTQHAMAAVTAEDRAIMAEKLDIYADFIRAARGLDIQVVFAVGPTFRDGVEMGPKESLAYEAFQHVAEQQDALFLRLDASAVPELADRKYFRDRRHLNSDGADLFTRRLVEAIRSFDSRTTTSQ